MYANLMEQGERVSPNPEINNQINTALYNEAYFRLPVDPANQRRALASNQFNPFDFVPLPNSYFNQRDYPAFYANPMQYNRPFQPFQQRYMPQSPWSQMPQEQRCFCPHPPWTPDPRFMPRPDFPELRRRPQWEPPYVPRARQPWQQNEPWQRPHWQPERPGPNFPGDRTHDRPHDRPYERPDERPPRRRDRDRDRDNPRRRRHEEPVPPGPIERPPSRDRIPQAPQNVRRYQGVIPQNERRALMELALRTAGVEVSEAMINGLNTIIQRESGWNPNIVNNWDSNARKGTPSKGLMQTIGPTFDRYKMPGHDDILNPLHNMLAGIRYATRRYGNLLNVPGLVSMRNGGRYRGY